MRNSGANWRGTGRPVPYKDRRWSRGPRSAEVGKL